jgi:hypothetical protein
MNNSAAAQSTQNPTRRHHSAGQDAQEELGWAAQAAHAVQVALDRRDNGGPEENPGGETRRCE